MRPNALAWVLSTIVAAAALSAVVATVTVQFLYPAHRQAPITTTAAAPVQSAAQSATQPAQTGTQPVPVPAPAPAQAARPVQAPVKAGSPTEQVALDVLTRAAAGDVAGALTRTRGVSEASLKEQVTRHAPTVQRTALLPGGARVLVWADYRLPGLDVRGVYDVTVREGKVTAINGPLTPDNGYRQLSLQPQDETGQPVDMAAYKGRALLLVSPRAPEAGLVEFLTHMQATYGPRGVDVILVLDIRSPDWLTAARQGGYKGPVWRVKSRLEDVPLVSKAALLGAYGVLVDPAGYAVASLSALDPLRYNLPEQPPADIAQQVLQAYGLLP